MYDAILVGTDGSEGAQAAVEHAIDLARLSEATVHAVYAIETRTAYDTAIVDPKRVEAALTEEGESALDDVRALAGDEVEVVTAIETGPPHEVLLTYAARHGIDLLVVGAHGRSSFKERLLGSTADRAVRESPIPVLVVEG